MRDGVEYQNNFRSLLDEYSVIKQVLMNNSIPVNLTEIQSSSRKGRGMRLLFDKKTFYEQLVDLERLRKVLNLKKQIFIFNVEYLGKPTHLTSWRHKVNQRIANTLKFMNTARTLKIIGYEPKYQLKLEQIDLRSTNRRLRFLQEEELGVLPTLKTMRS